MTTGSLAKLLFGLLRVHDFVVTYFEAGFNFVSSLDSGLYRSDLVCPILRDTRYLNVIVYWGWDRF